MQFEYRVAGIPCIIDAFEISVVKGEGYSAPSDQDARGWVESYFEVLDRRGRRAQWLERKLNSKMVAEIKQEIAERV